MARNENPPFARGETFYGGRTIDSNNLGGENYEGMLWEFEDVDWSSTAPGAKPHRSGRKVLCLCVRNNAAAALLPKRVARYELTAGGTCVGTVNGYTRLTAERGAGIVDEFLPAAGVPVGDLFWLVVKGPSLCLTPLSDQSADTAVGGNLVAITAATSGATTAGRVTNQDLTGATALLADQVQNRIGRAMSTALTNATNSSILVDVGVW